MMFIEEQKLKEAFWSKYNYRKNILRYQFECPIRNGGIDLLTIESLKDKDRTLTVQVNAFEFKLSDIKKAIAQAEENLNYAHKSWIVIPHEKGKIIKDKYLNYLEQKKYIGCISVELDGRWTIIYQPWTQPDHHLKFNQGIAKLMLNEL